MTKEGKQELLLQEKDQRAELGAATQAGIWQKTL